MPFAEFLSLSLFAWIGSFTPGPNVAIATATGVNHGLRAALPQIFGVPLGSISLAWIIGMGGAAILQSYPVLLSGIKLMGTAYLLLLAWRLCFSGSFSESKMLQPLSVRQSMVFQMLNPKSWMILIAATSTYAIGQQDFFIRMGWLSFGFALSSSLSLLAWAWIGQKLRHWLLIGQRLRRFNLFMGTLLGLTAVFMLFL